MRIANPIAETKRAVKSAGVRACAASRPRGVAKNATPAEKYGPPPPPVPNAETIAAFNDARAGRTRKIDNFEEFLAELNA